MSYKAPYIDETGLHISDYATVRDYLISEFLRIFGQDLYLGEDTQDYQMISLFSDALDDVGALVIEAYNSRNPEFARGNSLDLMLPLNGIIRFAATHSTAVVTLSGDEYAVIPAGSIVLDSNNRQWVIQDEKTIPESGSIDVEVRAYSSGYIPAGVGSIRTIGTPTAGWVSVTNELDAIPGRDAETDAEVRSRRLASVENLAVGVIQALSGSLLEVEGVKKIRVYENSTTDVDDNGIPAHSISVIVDGGNSEELANVIYSKKSPGCGLYGDVVIPVTDDFGNTVDISFKRPIPKQVEVEIQARIFLGYTDTVRDSIKNGIAKYISNLEIGETLETGLLWGVALSSNPNAKSAVFAPASIKVSIAGGVLSEIPIIPQFDERFYCYASDVTVTTI